VGSRVKLCRIPVKSLITFQYQAPQQLGIDPAFEEAELWQGSQPWKSALATSFGSPLRIIRLVGIRSLRANRQDNPSNKQRERARRHADDATL